MPFTAAKSASISFVMSLSATKTPTKPVHLGKCPAKI